MNTLKLIVIDKDMTSCEIEIDSYQFKNLGIDIKNAKIHTGKRDLNVTVTEFLEKVKEVKNDKENKNK